MSFSIHLINTLNYNIINALSNRSKLTCSYSITAGSSVDFLNEE